MTEERAIQLVEDTAPIAIDMVVFGKAIVHAIYRDNELEAQKQVCENCEHITPLHDWCNEIEHGFPCDYIEGCNKFKPKEK